MDRSGSKLGKEYFFLGGGGVSGDGKRSGGGMGKGGAGGGGEAGGTGGAGVPWSSVLFQSVTNWHFSRSFHFYFIALTLVVTV